jgi:aryl-alcohol dehydrogenase-like predicted oxidoreductase
MDNFVLVWRAREYDPRDDEAKGYLDGPEGSRFGGVHSMTIDRYYTLGKSGLRVSQLALGTMTFGTEWGWGADEGTARQLFDAYLDAGGNFIDTAEGYTNGTSETWVGRFVADRAARDRVVLTTKFSYSFFGPELQGMIHGGKPVGSKPVGYQPEVLIEGAGAGVE